MQSWRRLKFFSLAYRTGHVSAHSLGHHFKMLILLSFGNKLYKAQVSIQTLHVLSDKADRLKIKHLVFQEKQNCALVAYIFEKRA